MIKPIYQGQIDVFCAAYAVINSIRIAKKIRLLEARTILHNALFDIAKDFTVFQKILNQETDYVFWVDTILEQEVQKGSLIVQKGFPELSSQNNLYIPSDSIWSTIETWLSKGNKYTCIFQFIRQIPTKNLTIQHWTCGYKIIHNKTLLFADSSCEPDSLQSLEKKNLIATSKDLIDGVFIKPHTLRLICPRIKI